MKFKAFGGGIPLGKTHLLLEIEGKRVAIDCGAEIGRNNSITMPPMADESIDLLLVTHGHLDHIGALAYFAKRHPETKILGTKVTRSFTRMLLWDSVKITAQKLPEGQKVEVYFTGDDVCELMSRFKAVRNSEWFSPWPGWKIRFVPAGHINGAASIQIITPNNIGIMFSGDICFNNQPTIMGAKVPSRDFRPHLLFVEATYGDRSLPDRQKEEDKLIDRTREVLKRGGFVLIPTFAISGVNIALISANAGIPTYIDGMIRKAAQIINLSDPWSENDKPKFIFPDNPMRVINAQHRRQILKGKPAVIVTTHGMLEGGPVWQYIPYILRDGKSAVLIPGYQAEETGGYHLLRLERGQALEHGNEKYDVYCDVERFYLSAHASGKEIARWVAEINPWEVVVVHATRAGFEGLKQKIKERSPVIRVQGAFNGQELLDEWI